ncbi:MAG TPA: hypothetical protein VN327_06390 [Pseudonocardiaceae bacterium]|jgi:hypothetical protein|nr:hypothetical protein [Pseudonocardiaceae bacterium]
MSTETTGGGEPTLLKALLRARHWQKHSTFAREWDKVAKAIDPQLKGSWPQHAQFYRWLRGDLRGLPYPDACRVLAAMFPEYNVRDLFQPYSLDTAHNMMRSGGPAAHDATHEPDPLGEAGVSRLWPRTGPDVLHDLMLRVSGAREEVSMFGLTRNIYTSDEMLPLFESKAHEIAVTFYVMDPHCDSRKDRYRIEPTEAEMEDPDRFKREILRPLFAASQRVPASAPSAGLRIFTYNFPCSFAIEKIDRSCRVMLYGHGKRGTEGPIFVFNDNTPYWNYFAGQIQWLERLAESPREPWTSKGLVVRPLREADLA